jgi:hypothetical protein
MEHTTTTTTTKVFDAANPTRDDWSILSRVLKLEKPAKPTGKVAADCRRLEMLAIEALGRSGADLVRCCASSAVERVMDEFDLCASDAIQWCIDACVQAYPTQTPRPKSCWCWDAGRCGIAIYVRSRIRYAMCHERKRRAHDVLVRVDDLIRTPSASDSKLEYLEVAAAGLEWCR